MHIVNSLTNTLPLTEARQKVDEAEAYLERVKKGGSPKGALWWMERELHEARAFLPKAKGGYNKREGAPLQ